MLRRIVLVSLNFGCKVFEEHIVTKNFLFSSDNINTYKAVYYDVKDSKIAFMYT